MNIALIGNSVLRQAIQRNLVSFPAQVPVCMKRRVGDTPAPVDKEERIIQLYFVRNWPVKNICDRYSMSKPLVQKILTEWRIRAVAGGYIQDIDPDSLDLLVSVCEARMQEVRLQEMPRAETAKEKMPVLTMFAGAGRADDDADITLPDSVWKVFASVKSDPATAGRGV
jgi:hypothetical protein